MKLNILGLSSIAMLLLSTSLVDAKILSSSEAWQVRKVNADTPYCTLSRRYDGDIKVTIAKNKNDEGTIALDFGRQAFDTGREYPIKFNVGDVTRNYNITPASASVMIVRVGQDNSLYSAMRLANTMDVRIDQEDFGVGLSGTNKAFNDFDGCLGQTYQAHRLVDAKKAVPLQPVTQQLTQQNTQIDQLLIENRRLTALLAENTKRVPVALPSSLTQNIESLQKVTRLQTELSKVQRENTNLMAQISKMKNDLTSSGQNINPDLSGVLAEKNKQVELLIQQNKSLENALRLAEAQPAKIKEVIKEVEVFSPKIASENSVLKSKIALLQNKLTDMSGQKPQTVIKEVEIVKEIPTTDPAMLRQNQQMKTVIARMESEIASLKSREPETVVKEIIKEVEVFSPKIASENSVLKSKIALLQNKLTDMSGQKPETVIKEVETVKEVIKEIPTSNPEMLRQNQQMQNAIINLEKQINALQDDNMALSKRASNTSIPEVIVKEVEVIKEVIKEVPVYADGATADNSQTSMQLAEAETQAKTYQAERDEYRRLLQTERRRLREGVNVAGQIKNVTSNEGDLVSDVRRLEKEKVELIRQLEYAKTTGQVVEMASQTEGTTSKLNALSLQLSDTQNKLKKAEVEKKKLQKRMVMIDFEAVMIQRQLAESKIAKLADDRPEIIREELEAKTLRSEIASLEAQNRLLQSDIGIEKQKIEKMQKLSEPIDVAAVVKSPAMATNDNEMVRVSRPVDRAQRSQSLRSRLQEAENDNVGSAAVVASVQIANIPQPALQIQRAPVKSVPQMVALSGDEIRQLVSQSKIPLASSVDRIDRVSGPDFAAFRWDTGIVYGSGEQSRLNNVSAFDSSVQQYIQKTASRCEGSFDQNINAINTSNGLTVKSADIACVDNNATGSAASILFFVRDGMFYALAHEANMDSFKVAMDMRDRLVGSIDQIF